MIKLIFSLDYEIYGSGIGNFDELMIEPTQKLLNLFDSYNAKLSIMAEIGEILAIKKNSEYREQIEKIENQLQSAVAGGHDVQLHIHPGWFNANYENKKWLLDYNEYSLSLLPERKIFEYIHQGKAYLETICKKADKSYRCIAFRAGNWLIQPSKNIIKALKENDIIIDTTVFKGGYGEYGPYKLDFRNAYHNFRTWRIDQEDINRRSDSNNVYEIPILTYETNILKMLTPKRILTEIKLRTKNRSADDNGYGELGSGRNRKKISLKMPKKFDFSRMTFSEMRNYIRRVDKEKRNNEDVVIVAIGHSTELDDLTDVKKLLQYINSIQSVEWTTFKNVADEYKKIG